MTERAGPVMLLAEDYVCWDCQIVTDRETKPLVDSIENHCTLHLVTGADPCSLLNQVPYAEY